MKERGVEEEQAKEICREEIKKYATKLSRIVDKTKANSMLSRDLRAYIEAVQVQLQR